MEALTALEKVWYDRPKAQWPWEYENTDAFIHKISGDIQSRFRNKDDKGFTFETNTLLEQGQAAVPKGFRGREAEIEGIKQKLKDGGRLIVLKGEGGIGKSTLASKYLEQYGNDYQNRAWIFCQKGIVEDLKALVNDPEYFNDCLDDKDGSKTIHKLQQYLYQLPSNTILVLDNLNHNDDYRIFKQNFRNLQWHVLATSRIGEKLDDEFLIKHLPPPIATELFKAEYDENTPDFDTLLERLLKAVGYNTLLIEILSQHLREAADVGDDLKVFIGKFEEAGLSLKKDAFLLNTHYTSNVHKAFAGDKATVDQILEILYDFSSLDEDENLRYYLVNMALLPAQAYEARFLESLFGDREKGILACNHYLNPLAAKGWLSREDRTYRLSPVVQDLALAKNHPTLATDAQALLDRLNSILEADADNLLNISLPDAAPYVQPVQHLSKCLREHPSWDIASYNFSVGIYYNNTGDLVEGRKCYENYRTIYQQLLSTEPENLSYKNGLAISYEKLGGIYEATGDWKNALLNYEEYNRLEKEIYESSPENLSYKNGLAISYEKLGGIYEATGDWKNALLNYEEDFRITKEIYESSPENLSYKNGLAISYQNLGDIYNGTGDWKNALLNYEERNRIGKEIYESSPENLSYKNGLAISYEKLGGIYEATGDWKNALLNYEEYNRLEKEIYESSPENLSYKNGLAISYQNLGNIYNATGDWKNALLNYEEYNRLEKEIYESSPENLSYKNGLAISYSKLGGIYEATGDWKNALLNYEEDFRITKEIYESSPENLSYKNGLAISYQNLGDIYNGTGDWKNALLNYEERNRIGKEIYESSPENLSYKNGLAISYSKLGGIYEATGDWKNALLNYEEQLRIFKEIYESSPENLSYKNGLAISYSKLGGIYEATGDWKNALLNYEERNRIGKEIYESSPENLSYKNGLAISYSKLGGIYEATGDWKNALLNYEEQLRIFKEIYESSPENLSYKNGLAISYSKLGGIYEATGDWKNALLNYEEQLRIFKEIYESSPENLSYKNGLAISYARLGTFYLKQNQIGEALTHFLESRTLFAELWQATQGQIVQFTFYFAMNTHDVTRIVKYLLQENQYPAEQAPSIKESIKAMRQEGYAALRPLAEAGVLQENQKWLVAELGEEAWYAF